VGEASRWVPRGLTFELDGPDGPPPELRPPPPLHLDGLRPGRPGTTNEVVATKIRPAYAAMLGSRARALAATGRFAEAAAPLATALELDPENARLHLLAGDLAAAQGDEARARGAYEAAVHLAPDDPEVAARLEAMRR
jgi:tetratricopeptide (TPR) repeat protein